jgi:hypothetical protein
MIAIRCIDILVRIHTTGERNGWIVKQVPDTGIPGIIEFSILNAAVRRCRTCDNQLKNFHLRLSWSTYLEWRQSQPRSTDLDSICKERYD